jgi:hypothetical protein
MDDMLRGRQPRMATFYREMRLRLGLLVDDDGSPTGGEWSFDQQNRRPPPKSRDLGAPPPWLPPAADPLDVALRKEFAGLPETGAGGERVMAATAEPTVPCNNDLLAGNFIDEGPQIRLIDYEYSGNNEASFELGNIWSESTLPDELLEVLVHSYWEGVSSQELAAKVARARLWGLMSKYGWTLWASISASISPIDFDYWGWGMEKYERAVAEFDGGEFERFVGVLTH